MTAVGRIKVVKMPPGEEPENVRAAWVRLELPAYRTHENPFTVPQAEALVILKRANIHAARYYEEQGYPHVGGVFLFPTTHADVVQHAPKERKSAPAL